MLPSPSSRRRDGPIGAAAIAHALEIGLGGKPILLSEARNMPAVIASTEAAGIAVVGEDIFVKRRSCALAIDFPLGSAAGERASRELIETYDPAAIVFVEKAGPNEKGVFHSILGTPRTPDTMANAHFLALAARDRKILTIGIADGGNEIGCGLIADAVRDVQPHGKSCGCPCGGGIGTIIGCDVLVFAAVSEAGALTAWRRRSPACSTIVRCCTMQPRSGAWCTNASMAERWTARIPG